jgi:hypothetical protein
MWQRRSAEIRHRIAGSLTSGASLLVGYLVYGTSLTSRTVLATLAEDGPTRLTALAVGTGVSQPAKTHQRGAHSVPPRRCRAGHGHACCLTGYRATDPRVRRTATLTVALGTLI